METNLATVVTAFFPIPSKAPPSFYLEIAGRFLKNCPAQIILFTITKYVSFFQTMRGTLGNLIIYEMELDEIGLPLESPVKNWIPMTMWEKTAEIFNTRSPRFGNNISVQLMILYLSKAWFVQKAISKMELGEQPIFWHDIGSAREKEDMPRLRKWPLVSKVGDCSDNKIRFFKRMDLPDTYCYDCDNWSFIAGSHIYGNKKAWEPIIDDIKNAVLDNVSKYEDGLCDETIYLKLVMTLPDRYTTIGPNMEWYKTFELHGDNKLVLDVSIDSLIIYPSHEETNQIFILIYTEDKEYFSIKSKSNNLVISEQSDLIFEEYNGSEEQLFRFVKKIGKYGYLENKKSQKVLDVCNFGRGNTRILLWELNGGDNQLFCFNEISPEEYQIQVNYT